MDGWSSGPNQRKAPSIRSCRPRGTGPRRPGLACVSWPAADQGAALPRRRDGRDEITILPGLARSRSPALSRQGGPWRSLRVHVHALAGHRTPGPVHERFPPCRLKQVGHDAASLPLLGQGWDAPSAGHAAGSSWFPPRGQKRVQKVSSKNTLKTRASLVLRQRVTKLKGVSWPCRVLGVLFLICSLRAPQNHRPQTNASALNTIERMPRQ